MVNAINLLSAGMESQTLSMQMAVKSLSAQKQQGEIALQLLAGAIQDPSTVTAAQLQSPIDIRV